MSNTSFANAAAALSRLLTHAPVPRRLAALLVTATLAASVCAQSDAAGARKAGRQSPENPLVVTQAREATAAALASARSKGSEVIGIVELPTPIIPSAIEHRRGQGDIVAVYVRSLTTDWAGVSYSTEASPITGFSQAVERFGASHRQANPDDNLSLFAVEAFAVRAAPDSLEQWLAMFPDAELAYAHDPSPEGLEQLRERHAEALAEVYSPRRGEDAGTPGGQTDASKAGPAAGATARAASSVAFMPTSATLSIDAPAADKRMIRGTFSWSSEDALAGLKGLLTTLEIQVLFLNHSSDKSQKVTYAGDKIDFAVSWSDGYYDTTLLNDSGLPGSQGNPQEREYSVGTTNASKFKPNTTYSFWISTKPGVLAANMVKFSAQKGKYVPGPGCDFKPEWCVVSYESLGGKTDFFSPSMLSGPRLSNGTQPETRFSIVAPTAYRFTYPTQLCSIPPAQPELSVKVHDVPASDAKILGGQMAAVTKAFTDNGGQQNVGCATTRLHEDRTWWPKGGKLQDFNGGRGGKGAIMLSPGKDRAYWVRGGIWERYVQIGGPASALGAPTSDEYAWNGGARNDFEGGHIYWTPWGGAVVVRNQQPTPTVGNLAWSATPRAGQPFSGNVSGTGFVTGATRVFFCPANAYPCYEHPQAGVKVNSATDLRVGAVSASAGQWQVYVQTPAGYSQRSAPFTVLSPATSCAAAVAADRWKGEYFNSLDLSGSPVMVRDDGSNSTPFFAHDWGTGSPSANCGVKADGFSARWTRRQSFEAGRYRFTLRADDGVRFYVDGVRRLDRWVDQAPSNQNVELDISAGQHDLRVEYYERGGGAVAQIYWERIAGPSLPTVSNYAWSATPRPGQPFGGTVNGTGFVVGGTQVYFCLNGSTTCYEHPRSGVTVSGPTSMKVSAVSLGAGSWQLYVKTSAGPSAKSSAFTVQTAPQPPTVGGYSWGTTPVAGQPFGGSVSGTGFVSGDTQLWFCVSGSNSCYQHPTSGVKVNSSTSLTAGGVSLGAGSWQLYVKTPAGQSGRSSAFGVASPPARPTVTGYSWSSTPRADQSFGGTVNGTRFVSGGTQVYFCLTGTNSCYQHPSAGVSVNSSTRLSVSGVRLDSGSWQLYVKTSAGQSDRSSAFAVFIGSPTVSGYSWSTTPRAGQSFGGTLSGSNFVPGGTQVYFCVAGTSTCYQHPSAGVTVNSLTRLSVSGVRLGVGSWQVYVQTYAGASSRSSTFTIR